MAFWNRHFNNINGGDAPLTPTSASHYGSTFEQGRDLPYTVLSDEEYDDDGCPILYPHGMITSEELEQIRPSNPGIPTDDDIRQLYPSRFQQPLRLPSPKLTFRPQLPSIQTLLRHTGPPEHLKDTNAPTATSANIMASPGKENAGIRGRRVGTTVWDGNGLNMLARAMLTVKPYLAKHGKKGKCWEEVRSVMLQDGFKHREVNSAAFQRKGDDLVKFWKDPNSVQPGVKSIAAVLRENSAPKITIASTMDRVEAECDEAKNKSDEAKAELAKQKEENFLGGEEIRNNSKTTMRSRMARQAQLVDTGSDSDSEGTDPGTPSRKRKASKQASSSSLDGEKPVRKRQRTSIRRSSTTRDLLDYMKEEAEERREQHGDVMHLLKKQGKEMNDTLGGFLQLERERFERDK
ncbi:hypothetical protein BDP27DRAFT_1421038 [Rhodocollybia butyracea]|uniref:Uncharacterized protein n=1 Tax=Rhodocollybia butyracea TaxID=206335 RepID=A0A9P5PVR3_9AGAR|nr:hypothetical protein BDP27DRAFT_1421038 [Rhodocollybia butyracea]